MTALLLILLPMPSIGQQRQVVDLVIRAGALITMDVQRSIIEDGLVAISNGRIVDIGKRSALDNRYAPAKIIEAQGKAVLPGLINLHTHSYLIMFRGLTDDYEWLEWGRVLGTLERKNNTPDFRKWGNYLACLEMMKRGTTTFVEMYNFPDSLAEVAKHAGLRALASLRLPFDRQTEKFDPARAETEFQEFYNRWRADPLITPALAAHAPNTVPTEVLKFTKKLADKYDVRLLIHLAENEYELGDIRQKFGKTPTQYLDDLGFFSDRVLAAHAVRLTEDDVQILVKRRVAVSYNPEAGAKGGKGVAPIPDMLKAGIRVGLGTDGGVSNNNLDIFEEMDLAIKLQRAVHKNRALMTARQAVEMATIGGASAIGMQNEIGSLEKGKKADIIVVALDKPELQPVYDYYSHLVYVVKGGDVDTTIVDGRALMEHRKVLTLDEVEIQKNVEIHRRRVIENMKKP